ncbi:beta/gamma crystallin-related protein [Prosthecobacter sp.]|uniref:beta/gamma crystallin-related protein n=1 Tax=Prosthecobacter sp. TaxID=1965333 RepID=UPI002487E555|nr:beta/gamma crystallin-related protein [Prosthecobacter sp.]MDI1312854.1 beta/gamma crystallin-related protein [Prosthecobacter sp.]
MKLHHTLLLTLFGLLTLASCSGHLPNTSPAYYNPNCYANIYEDSDLHGEVVQIQGPASFSSLKHLKGRDWDSMISSIQTGPGCWLVLYKDKDFKDTSMVIGPNTTTAKLGEMDDEVESIKVFDRLP